MKEIKRLVFNFAIGRMPGLAIAGPIGSRGTFETTEKNLIKNNKNTK